MILLPVLLFYYQQFALGQTSSTTIRDFIVVEALIKGVDPVLAQEIVNRESRFNCASIGDKGKSYGCWQIHLPAHKEITPAQALDPVFSTEWAMGQLVAGNCRIWTTCPLSSP